MQAAALRWFFALSAVLLPAAGAFADTTARTPPTHTIYLVRHGAYDTQAKADPQSGPGLTSLGIAESQMVAARLRSMPVHFDSMTSSTMTRARETAAVIHEALPDVPFDRSPQLSECTPPVPGKLEGESAAEMAACAKRLDSVFQARFKPAIGADRNDVLVCHGNVIRYLVMRALGVDPRAWVGMSIAHTSVSVIRVRADGSMTVLSVGDVGHVPENMQSWGTQSDPQLVVP
jgi:serine/threonine-protein phosphatase PGAM5